jgi:hypothetical protein
MFSLKCVQFTSHVDYIIRLDPYRARDLFRAVMGGPPVFISLSEADGGSFMEENYVKSLWLKVLTLCRCEHIDRN